MSGHLRHSVKEVVRNPSLKIMGVRVPRTFSKEGCEKSFFENYGCQGTHGVRTLSFFDDVQ